MATAAAAALPLPLGSGVARRVARRRPEPPETLRADAEVAATGRGRALPGDEGGGGGLAALALLLGPRAAGPARP